MVSQFVKWFPWSWSQWLLVEHEMQGWSKVVILRHFQIWSCYTVHPLIDMLVTVNIFEDYSSGAWTLQSVYLPVEDKWQAEPPISLTFSVPHARTERCKSALFSNQEIAARFLRIAPFILYFFVFFFFNRVVLTSFTAWAYLHCPASTCSAVMKLTTLTLPFITITIFTDCLKQNYCWWWSWTIISNVSPDQRV